MHKVMVVFGTRPEAIKMCPLVVELRRKKEIECIVCLTAQHREMLDQVIKVFNINIDYDLDIMKKNQTLIDITVRVMQGLERIMEQEKPSLVLVHGDTTTSFAAALSAFYKRIPVGHVEAGLRTYNMNAPYPEEYNRQSVDLLCNMYFAPTKTAKDNLLREGKKQENIYITGNTVIDALRTTIKESYNDENIEWAKNSRLIIVTAHRRENQGMPMCCMFNAIKRIAEEYEDVKILFPVHRNPQIRALVDNILSDIVNVKLIEPVDPIRFHNYMNRCYLILTDSGGIQEEASAMGKPVLVMRNTTERTEGIIAGALKLVGTEEEKIYIETKKLLDDSEQYRRMSEAENPYGDGHASERIVEHILKNISNFESL